jgi:hypothetical protein
MKKEHFILLVFIASAALVSGYTLAFTSCFKVITDHNGGTAAILAHQQIENNGSHPDEANKAAPGEEGLTSLADTQSSSIGTGSSQHSEIMIIDNSEKAEIDAMLAALGLEEGQESSQFIKEFQEQQSLDPTGNLDSTTLNRIMQKLKLETVTQRLQS